MSFIKYVFTPNYVKYEGVRPINIYLLRLLYFLMFVGVGLQTWSTIINHQGPWDHTKALYLWTVAAAKVAADRDLHDLLQDALGYRGGLSLVAGRRACGLTRRRNGPHFHLGPGDNSHRAVGVCI
jgi:hypothetical protein